MKKAETKIIQLFIILSPWLLIIITLYQLQIVKASYFNSSLEAIESKQFKVLLPKRGNIYVQDKYGTLYPVAISIKSYDVYFNGKLTKDKYTELKEIKKILVDLGIKEEEIGEEVVLLKKGVDESTKEKIQQLNYDSIFFEVRYKRFYPEKDFLSTIVGFTIPNEEGVLEGKYGIEKFYDNILRGDVGYHIGLNNVTKPKNGEDIILNIDYFVQKEAERVLDEAVKEHNASGGLIGVSTNDGKILAIAEFPRYDLNKFNEIKDYSIFLTKFTQNYEPGSVMKIFTFLSAIENGIFEENLKYFDAGYVTIDGWKIENFDKKGRGEVTLGEAFEQSLNTGAVYLEKLVGHNRFLKTLLKFGFDKTPDIDLPYLTKGNLKNLKSENMRDVNFATASFGHGISVSPAHIISAMNSISSGGRFVSLRLLSNTKENFGKKILDSNTVEKIKNLLERVVLNGSGKKAKTEGFRIGGKTGSALVPLENKGGYSDELINSFVCIFPLTNPKFTILVRLDRPKEGLARVTTGPAMKRMIEFLINYYNLQPDNLESH